MPPTNEPQLAPPGAGLPFAELWIARAITGLVRLTGTRESFVADFRRERAAIRALVESCHGEALTKRVLIARPRGLEDSSRYWSVLMTLDHLRIVHHGIAPLFAALAQGQPPQRTASTAAVKPSTEVSHDIIADYEASCDAILSAQAAIENLKTSARYAHPWFGPLDAFGWLAMARNHLRIHRIQIERILAGLKVLPTAPI